MSHKSQLIVSDFHSTVNCPGRTTEETSTPNKSCRKCCKNDERPTGTITSN